MTGSRHRILATAISAVLALGAAGCAGSGGSAGTPVGGTDWKAATSAQAGGGMDALVAAAKAEGALNVIALPPDLAGYGAVIKAFSDRYGIKVDSVNPDGSSQDEIDAVKQLGSQNRAPDVLDVGQTFATGDVDLYAPYKVATFGKIPAADKDPGGAWVYGYGGYVSIGCNAEVVDNCPQSFADLTKPEYNGMITINGNPTQAAAAFAGVWAGSLANGGTLDDIAPGLAFWGDLARSGNLLKVDPDSATIRDGRSPIVVDWDYLNVSEIAKNKADFPWEVVVPSDGLFAQYYAQAINRNAPHPAAARLWEEFLFSDQGQNLWLAGKVRPVRLAQMTADGTADKALVAVLPPVTGAARFVPTQVQVDAAQKTVAQTWATITS